MNMHHRIQRMVLSALLIAVGIIIPMVSPIRVVIEPASFTLGSHVAIIIAMFISPFCAVSVAVGTTLGFFFGGFTLPVVARAASQVVFAGCGAWYLRKHNDVFTNPFHTMSFIFVIGLIHAICELIVVLPFYINGSLSSSAFIYQLLVLTGIGTLIHGSVDYVISLVVWKSLLRVRSIKDSATITDVSWNMKTKEMRKQA